MRLRAARTWKALAIAALAASVLTARGQQTSPTDALVNKLVQKGILTDGEAKELLAETAQTNPPVSSKWILSDAIKSVNLYGDIRFRYEYRGADNALGSGHRRRPLRVVGP